jgi:hypothetical protein
MPQLNWHQIAVLRCLNRSGYGNVVKSAVKDYERQGGGADPRHSLSLTRTPKPVTEDEAEHPEWWT